MTSLCLDDALNVSFPGAADLLLGDCLGSLTFILFIMLIKKNKTDNLIYLENNDYKI